MSKPVLCGLIVVACSGWLSVADATYVIKLKNGNEYVTTRYWQEGRQLLFDTYGGVFGIEKAFVTKIEKADQVIRLATIADTGEKSQGDVLQKDKEPEQAKPSTEASAERKREPDDPIVGEFNRLKEKSTEVDGMLTSEIRDLLREIKAFKYKVSGNSKLFVEYSREFNDIHELSSAVEAAFNARR